jgi:glycosyltransferase involved in cell wall biosynthesis
MNKILIALPNDVMGGAEQYLFEMCQYLSRNNEIKVVFLKQPITNFWNNNVQSKNVQLIYLNATSEKKGFIKFLKWSFSNKSNFNYAITSHLHLNGILGFLRKINLLKIENHIARESTYIFDRFSGLKLLEFKSFYKMGYNKIDLLITQSEEMKKKLLKGLTKSMIPKQINTIPNLLNLNNIQNKSIEFLPNHKNYIITAGRLIPEKGFDILIEAYNNIKNEIGNIKLLILGEGKERKKLEDLIDRFNLGAKVKLLGFKENPMSYFKYADLCVVSSRVEGFPNVLLQMMTLNGNVVSTLCAGGIDEIEGIQTCEADNIETLANTMLEAIKNKIDNSKLFQQELETRRIEKYWNQIEAYLDES